MTGLAQSIHAEKADFHERHHAPCARCRSAATGERPTNGEPRSLRCGPDCEASSLCVGPQSAFCCVWSSPVPAVTLKRGFDATSALIVASHVGKPDCQRI